MGLSARRVSFVSEFYQHQNIFTNCSKDPVSNYTKIRPIRVALFHADGRRDMTRYVAAIHFPTTPPAPQKVTQGPQIQRDLQSCHLVGLSGSDHKHVLPTDRQTAAQLTAFKFHETDTASG